HDAGDGLTEDVVACDQDDDREDDGDHAVEPAEVRVPDDDEADDDAGGAVGVGLEVFAAGGEGHAVVAAAPGDADGADDEVDDGGEGYDVDALVELLDGVG